MNDKVDAQDVAGFQARLCAAADSQNTNNSEVFYQHDPDRTAIALVTLMQCAKNSIRVLSTDLDNRIWGRPEVIAAARPLALADGLHVTVTKDLNRNGAAKNLFVSALGSRFELRRAAADVVLPCQFVVVDEKSFWLHSDVELPHMVVVFNDTDLAKQLTSIFDRVRSTAVVQYA